MTATFRSATGANITADGTNISAPTPSGTVAGDFLFCWVTGNGHNITAFDADYPQIGARQDGGAFPADMTCFGGVNTGTMPVYSIDVAGTPNANIGVIAVQRSGAGTLALDTGTGAPAQSIDGSSSTSHVSDSVTPNQDNSCICVAFEGYATGGMTGTTATFTERRDAEYWGHSYGASLDQTTAAAAACTMTSSANEATCKTMVVIYEAAAAATTRMLASLG